jgi:4'-phosphopantetheinyl transferase
MSLPEDEVHVVCASLNRPSVDVERLHRLLAADERDRAARFRFERDRSRYIVGRGLLRLLLARYVERPPEAISFAYGRFQKPRLGHEGPAFNLSHSGSLALYAFTSEEEVGIDIELDDADFARERIAEMFFSPTEVAALRSLPEAVQPRAFLTCWTRKEAFIKARGDGLQLALDSFDVSLVPTAQPELLRTQWSRDEPEQWSLRDLSDPEMGYIAALALRGRGWQLVSQRVPDNLDDTTEPQQEDT